LNVLPWQRAIPLLAGPARSADAAIVDSFSDVPGAVFHNILHPPAGGGRRRRVRTLADRDAEAGPLALLWDGRDERGTVASPGVHLVRATHAGTSATRRMVLAK